MKELSNMINQVDLIIIFRSLDHLENTPPNKQNILFQVHVELTEIDHILGHKTNFNKYFKTHTRFALWPQQD